MGQKFVQKLYDKSPAFVQTLALNAYALKVHAERYGRKFDAVRRELAETERYTPSEIADYQNAQLQRVVRHAYETVPYYRALFDRSGITPADIKDAADLRKIPILTRDEVRIHSRRLISERFSKKELVYGHTSGTTGAPLNFFWDRNACVYTNAVDWRQKRWAGIEYGDRIALLLGRAVAPRGRNRPPFWRMDYLHNQLWMSTFHLSDENLWYYVNKLKEFRPRAIEGYPSAVYILARYLLARNLTFPVQAVLTSSETLYPGYRSTIEAAFECKVFDFYGLAERVLFATECEAHNGRHLNFEYGFTEIVDGEGNPVPDGQPGFVVSTSLQNFGMPFIRYRTNDISQLATGPCECGRSMPRLSDLTTKADDIVVTPEGRMLPPAALTHPFKPLTRIARSQIVQTEVDRLVVKIVKGPGYGEDDTLKLTQALQQRVGPSMKVELKFVDDIPRTASGKYRWVISQVGLSDVVDAEALALVES